MAIVHDYLTVRGGAERVVLAMARAFPDAPIYTSLYEPGATFPEFRDMDVRASLLNHVAALRRDHQRALPLLPIAFRSMEVDADIALCSSSGWAHATRTKGRKIVYCHNPPRWLYQADQFLGDAASPLRRGALAALRPGLLALDRRAARSVDTYLANSRAVQSRVKETYGIDAVVVPAPIGLDVDGPQKPLPKLESGFLLCVARLMPYKNVDAVMRAFASLPYRLVVVGEGPEQATLEALQSDRIRMVGTADDDQLRWLYANCAGLVAASHEDYGLTPIEALAFGRPTAALGAGGYLDTVVDGTTGLLFDRPDPALIARAVTELMSRAWDQSAMAAHADNFTEARFAERLWAIVAEA